jgi:hypothetical protein
MTQAEAFRILESADDRPTARPFELIECAACDVRLVLISAILPAGSLRCMFCRSAMMRSPVSDEPFDGLSVDQRINRIFPMRDGLPPGGLLGDKAFNGRGDRVTKRDGDDDLDDRQDSDAAA